MQIQDRTEGLHQAAECPLRVVYADGEKNGEGENKEYRTLIREHFLDVVVNEVKVFRLVCTATDLPCLVLGRLLTEGLIERAEDVESLSLCESGCVARVFLKEKPLLKELEKREPTCCTGNRILAGKAEAANLKKLPEADWREEWIFTMAEAFGRDSGLHKRTGGTHSCYLGIEGRCVYSSEDIGRHNALDKCIGYMLQEGLPREKCMLFTTGRVPTDMVEKVIAAGVPVLISKAVPTENAVLLAGEYGLNLFCRAWPDRFDIYRDNR